MRPCATPADPEEGMRPRAPEKWAAKWLSICLLPVNLEEGTEDPGKLGSSVGIESLLRLALPPTLCYTPRGCQAGRAEKADARGRAF